MTIKSKSKLECIIKKNKFDLEYEIALEALTYYPNNTNRCFYEINNFGCVSGVVSKLKNLEDIKKFYFNHELEIEQIKRDYQISKNIIISSSGDSRYLFTWVAYEIKAFKMAMEYEIAV